MGSYGGGKTSACFDLAYQLYMTGRYRYILGNSNSVWTDSPEKVVLRDGSFVDAIVILDEGGLFMRLSTDADQFLLGLRKLNITILVPSVLPPSSRIKTLQIQRTFNGNSFGLPFWLYDYRLNLGSEKEKDWFAIYKPYEIFGIYDTLDYPIDDLYLSEWFDYWMHTARESRPEWCTWGHPPGYPKQRRGNRYSGGSGQDQGLVTLGGIVEEILDGQAELSDSISLHAFEEPTKRRKYRR